MTQAEIEKAASEYVRVETTKLSKAGYDVLEYAIRLAKAAFLDGAEHAKAEFEKLTSDLIAQAACAREQGARRLAEYLVHKSEYPCSSVDDLMQLWRDGRGK